MCFAEYCAGEHDLKFVLMFQIAKCAALYCDIMRGHRRMPVAVLMKSTRCSRRRWKLAVKMFMLA